MGSLGEGRWINLLTNANEVEEAVENLAQARSIALVRYAIFALFRREKFNPSRTKPRTRKDPRKNQIGPASGLASRIVTQPMIGPRDAWAFQSKALAGAPNSRCR